MSTPRDIVEGARQLQAKVDALGAGSPEEYNAEDVAFWKARATEWATETSALKGRISILEGMLLRTWTLLPADRLDAVDPEVTDLIRAMDGLKARTEFARYARERSAATEALKHVGKGRVTDRALDQRLKANRG